MSGPDKPLGEAFSAAAETKALEKKIRGWSFDHKFADGREVASPRDVEDLLELCEKIVKNQARQDIDAARQEKQQRQLIGQQQQIISLQNDAIRGLEKRLAAVEAEFAPQRPLPGKNPLDPKGPKS